MATGPPGECDAVGRVQIDPPLSAVEAEYLAAFVESRRWRRPGGPYAVPDNPLAEVLDLATDAVALARPAEGQPGVHCPWRLTTSADGLAALSGSDHAAWLAYLIDHFLAPAGIARGHPACVAFGFDHAAQGAVATFSRSTGELAVVKVCANEVRRYVVAPGSGAPGGAIGSGEPAGGDTAPAPR